VNDARNLLSQIQARRVPDDLVARCLDALREIEGMSYIDAVLEVARAHKASEDAGDLVEANKHLQKGSPIREALEQSIIAECPDVRCDAFVSIIVTEGDGWPVARDVSVEQDGHWLYPYLLSVGALWVKREASRLLIERERSMNRPLHSRAVPRRGRKGRAK
jgi:hypothetical protein